MLAFPIVGFAQATYAINNFSDEYYGKLRINDTSKVFSPGWIAVYNKKTNKQLIKVNSDELVFTPHNGKVKANIVEAPYGEQSVLIYDDFNFDGVKDFALMNGQNSCYHGPSFLIYLASGSTFVYNEEFTRLAQEYCGMFQYNTTEKKISTMTKSGCCWHQFCEFAVENNRPVLVKEVIADAFNNIGFPYGSAITTRIYQGEKIVSETATLYVDLNELKDDIRFSFKLEKSDKTAVILQYEKRLIYMLVKPDGTVEFNYPASINEEKDVDNFSLAQEENGYTLSFYNGYARYTIYEYSEPEKRVGVKVLVKGKTYDLAGKPDTKIKSLKDINMSGDNADRLAD